MSKSAWATNTMQIGLRIFGKVKVDHNIDRLDINSTGEQIWRNEKQIVKHSEL